MPFTMGTIESFEQKSDETGLMFQKITLAARWATEDREA